MGNRANLAIQGDDPTDRVYLYLHWAGTELPELARVALDTIPARNRWHDAPYLTRIMADQFSRRCDGPGCEHGMGISTRVCDDNHGAVLVLDTRTQEAYFERLPPDLAATAGKYQEITRRIPFEQFTRTPQHWPNGHD